MFPVIPKFRADFQFRADSLELAHDDDPTAGGTPCPGGGRTYRVDRGLRELLSHGDEQATELARELAGLEDELERTFNAELLTRVELRRRLGVEGFEYFTVVGFTVVEPTLCNWLLGLRLDLGEFEEAHRAAIAWHLKQLAEAPRHAARALFILLRPLLRLFGRLVAPGVVVARLIDRFDLPPPPLLTAGGKAAIHIPLC